MKNKFEKDLTHIRSMMEQSTRFVSLSGWSGILAGIYSLIGAYLGYKLVHNADRIIYYDIKAGVFSKGVTQMILIAGGVLVMTLLTGVITTYYKAKRENKKMWTPAARKLLLNMAIPLVIGGVFVLWLLQNRILGLIAPTTLIFYGLSLITASFFTFGDVKYLGMLEVTLGLISLWFIGSGLFFWALGFGVLHIVYGLIMYLRYDK